MDNLLVCLNAVLPLFLIMALGAAAQALRFLDRRDVSRLNKAMFRLFLPVMMFYNIYSSDLSSAVRPRLILFAEGAVLLVFSLCFFLVRRMSLPASHKGVIIQGVYRSNFVILGLPIVANLLGDVDLGPVVVLSAIVVPTFNALAVFVLEYFGGEKTSPRRLLLDILKNPLILGSAAGILALLIHLRLPAPLESTARQISQAATPIMLFLLGAFFRPEGLKGAGKELLWVCVGRLVLVPAAALGAAALLGFRGVEFAALISVFASSTAVSSFAMAQQMGGDEELAGSIVIATSTLCSFTLFLWCFLFKSLGLF